MLRKVTLFKVSFADYLKDAKIQDKSPQKDEIGTKLESNRLYCVKDKKLSLREASNRYGVPRRTLQD